MFRILIQKNIWVWVFAAYSTASATAGSLTERIPPDEEGSIEIISNYVVDGWHRLNSQSDIARRDAHAKAHGCVRARFSVNENNSSSIAIGLFSKSKTYDAWIRFSNGAGTPRADSVSDGRGMSIKILGVEGDKVLEGERDATTQDFLLINHPVFFVRNAADYIEFVRSENEGNPEAFYNSRPHEASISLAIAERIPADILNESYFSMTPYYLGEEFVKYAVKPVLCESGNEITEAFNEQASSNEPNYLNITLTERLEHASACFDFMVQLRTDPGRMPLEDPTIEWDRAVSPLQSVARIEIPPQHFNSPAQERYCENLSFTPWHSLPEHRPAGGINRVRRSIYEQISNLRHEANEPQAVEPSHMLEFQE